MDFEARVTASVVLQRDWMPANSLPGSKPVHFVTFAYQDKLFTLRSDVVFPVAELLKPHEYHLKLQARSFGNKTSFCLVSAEIEKGK